MAAKKTEGTRLVAAIATTDNPRAISCILTTLGRRIENSVEDFQKNVLEVLVASGSKRAVDVACEALRAEHSKERSFALYAGNIKHVLEMVPPEQRPAFARSVLDHARFPRTKLEPEVLTVLEQAAAAIGKVGILQ